MNPHSAPSVSLTAFIKSILQHRNLIVQLARREVIGRYRGSVFGLAWSFFFPLIMLTVYTFVFSVVFKAKWGVGHEQHQTNFAVILFAGMIVHSQFSDVLIRAPSLIIENSNYVKRVIFPLEILPVTSLLSVIFHTFISLIVLLLAVLLVYGHWYLSTLWLPVVFTPLILLSLGVGYMLASLGVYLRDVGQIMGVVVTILLFVSPVFFPLSSIPKQFQTIVLINPLTFIIEQVRAVLLFDESPNFAGLLIYLAVSILVLWIGFFWFQKTRKGFADVL